MRGTRTHCSTANSLFYAQAHRHLPHTITTMGIWAPPSRLTYAAENSHKHHQRTESWRIGDGDLTFDVSKIKIDSISRGPPSNGVCSRDLVMSRASSKSSISPLTASAVTRATTSLQTGPPFIVVRLVRELMSVRVHAASFLSPARRISCSI